MQNGKEEIGRRRKKEEEGKRKKEKEGIWKESGRGEGELGEGEKIENDFRI